MDNATDVFGYVSIFILEVHSLEHTRSEWSTCWFLAGDRVTQGGVGVCVFVTGLLRVVWVSVCL